MDAQGNLIFIESGNALLRRVDSSGNLVTIAQYADVGFANALAVDKAGNIYFQSETPAGDFIKKVTPSGVVTTVAGTGTFGYTGDGGPATNAAIGQVNDGMVIDASGNLLFSESIFNRIRRIDTKGIITTIAGTGPFGDSGAREAQFAVARPTCNGAVRGDAKVVMTPLVSTLRTAPLFASAMKMVPSGATAAPSAACSPALIAGPPSPEKERVPLPAMVEIIPAVLTLRTRVLDVMRFTSGGGWCGSVEAAASLKRRCRQWRRVVISARNVRRAAQVREGPYLVSKIRHDLRSAKRCSCAVEPPPCRFFRADGCKQHIFESVRALGFTEIGCGTAGAYRLSIEVARTGGPMGERKLRRLRRFFVWNSKYHGARLRL